MFISLTLVLRWKEKKIQDLKKTHKHTQKKNKTKTKKRRKTRARYYINKVENGHEFWMFISLTLVLHRKEKKNQD